MPILEQDSPVNGLKFLIIEFKMQPLALLLSHFFSKKIITKDTETLIQKDLIRRVRNLI